MLFEYIAIDTNSPTQPTPVCYFIIKEHDLNNLAYNDWKKVKDGDANRDYSLSFLIHQVIVEEL